MRALVFLIPALLSAADITTVPNPIALRLEFNATGANSKALSVSCSGYSRFTSLNRITLPGSTPVRQSAFTRFVGANSDCAPRAEAPFPARRVSSLSGVPESFVQHRRVVLQNVWPGVDVAYEVEGWHVRLTFLLESAAGVSAIRLQTSVSPSVPSAPADAFRLFAENVTASLRAEELTPYGANPTPVVFRDPQFALPANPAGPVRIILEADIPPEPDSSSRSAVDRDGSLYEVEGSLLRKFAPRGELLYESEFAGVTIDAILLDGTVELVGRSTGGILSFARVDPESGRFLSTVTGNGLSVSSVRVSRADSGGLLMLVQTFSPSFPRRGPSVGSSCVPFTSPFPNRLPSRSCTFAVSLSADGELLRSQSLPEYATATLVPDGTLFLIAETPARVLERHGATGVSTIPLPFLPGPTYLFPGSDSTLWCVASGRLYRLPRGGTAFQEVVGITGVDQVLPQEGGDVLVTGTALAAPSRDSLMDAPCTGDNRALAHVDSTGAIRYATYLPDLNPAPSSARVPALLGRKVAWHRSTLDPDAPSRPAIACTKNLQEAAPGSIAFLEVRGVPDESPFYTSWANLETIPTNVRGWSVRIDGIPAPILELDRTRLAILVPPALPSAPLPRNGTLEFFHQDRLVQSAALRLVPPAPRLLTGRLGPFDYTVSNQIGPLTVFTNWPTAGEEVRMFVHGSGPNPPRIFYSTGQPIPISTFRSLPGHPPGIYELRFVLPPPPAGPPPDHIRFPELGLILKVYFK